MMLQPTFDSGAVCQESTDLFWDTPTVDRLVYDMEDELCVPVFATNAAMGACKGAFAAITVSYTPL